MKTKTFKKELKVLSDQILLTIHWIDELMKGKNRGDKKDEMIAKVINRLEMANDHVRYFDLGVDFRTDDKSKILKKLLKSKGDI